MTQINKNPEHQKNLLLSPGTGYSLRKGSEPYTSFIVHTTNGAANSKSDAELAFLVNSPNVSAHYFISKSGEIFQILDPDQYVAWHAGEVSKDQYNNYSAIGVEVHFTPKEINWSGYMFAGLTRLARVFSNLEFATHRAVARPAGRKIDPSGFSDAQFKQWSTSINNDYNMARLRVNCNIRSLPAFGNNIIAVLPANTTVVVTGTPVKGDTYNNNDLWYNCNWLGYVHASLLDLGGKV